jgi:parallel beta-helix repeat protein
MKSNTKSKILIALGILFALSPIIATNLRFNLGSSNKSSKYSDDINLDKENLKISAISGKIHIINNSGWVDFKNAGNCTGEGTYSEPYVIKDLEIDYAGSESCIWIENSDVYFRIENCTLYSSGFFLNIGIRFSYVNNSQLTNNNCSNNYNGIYLYNSYNNTIARNTICDNYKLGIELSYSFYNNITGNTVNRNERGIQLYLSDYNTISKNAANNNHFYGIGLGESDHNTISDNIANNNREGISLYSSDYNTVSGNILLGNDECIVENDCEGNILENNDCGIIPGYNLFFILGILAIVVTIISKKLKKS